MSALPKMSVDLWNVFYTAIAQGDLDQVMRITDLYHPDLNDITQIPSHLRFPPLTYAVLNEDLKLVEYFVDQGADVNLSTNHPELPNTAFQMALNKDCGDIALYLLEKNADHTGTDAEGNNALLQAFQTNNWRLIRYMYDSQKYCNPRAKNVHGDSFFDMILLIRTHLVEDLPMNLRDQAVWVHEHPWFIHRLIQWCDVETFRDEFSGVF